MLKIGTFILNLKKLDILMRNTILDVKLMYIFNDKIK